MEKSIENRTQGVKRLTERAEIMEVARGAKKTGNTKCETNILQSRKVGEVEMKEYIVQAYSQETIDSFEVHNAPELIRCKDCKNKEKDGISEGFHYCNINGLQVTDDWYCADGERAENTHC